VKWRVASVLAGAAVLAVVPLVLGTGGVNAAIRVLIAVLFAQSFNVLWSQTRLLSFGHAVYFGAGGFAVIHVMMAIEHGQLAWPTPLVPLAGLAAGLVAGAVAGYLSTARSGTYFAMITLAIGELLYTIAPKWQAMFGGEAGLSSMRMPWGGLDFGSYGQVYYVVLAWVLAGIAILHHLTGTVFGRLAIAVGDDELRMRFLGFRTRLIKTAVFAISAGMAGLAGGLLTLTTESVGYDVFAGSMSASAVMFTFIGGADVFLGPAVGAAVMTVFGQTLSDISRNWLLYEGAAFVFVILALPSGLAGGVGALLATGLPRRGAPRRAFGTAVAGTVLLALGLVVFAEALQRRGPGGPMGPAAPFQILGRTIDPATSNIWAAGAVVAVIGFGLLVRGRNRMQRLGAAS
jgi:branched-chain amino acid transport system permease protein